MEFINQLKTAGYHLAAMGKPREALENHRNLWKMWKKNMIYRGK